MTDPPPPIAESPDRPRLNGPTRETAGRARRAIITTGLCFNSAVPSFAIAQTTFSVVGCLLGIAIFVVAATYLVPTTIVRGILKNSLLRRAFLITYGVRYLACLVPIVIFVDIFVGMGTMISATALNALIDFGLFPTLNLYDGTGDIWSTIPGSMLLTLIQGVYLNVALIAIAMLLYLIFRSFATPVQRADTGCVECGFDLRAQSAGAACPECGSTAGSSEFAPTIPLRFSNAFLVGVIVIVTTLQAIAYVGAAFVLDPR